MTDKKKLELISGYVQKCYHESYYDMSNAIADIANLLESESAPITPEPGESGQSASAKEFLSKTTAVGVIERKGVGEYSMTYDVDKLASILVAYHNSVRPEVVVPSDELISEMICGMVFIRCVDLDNYVDEFKNDRSGLYDALLSELRRLNPSMTFTELNHEK